MRALAFLAFVFLILPLLLLAAGQFGFLRGSIPDEPGLRDGKLRPPSRTPNSVSSQADLWPAAEYDVDYARIEPIRFSGDPVAAMNRLDPGRSDRRGVVHADIRRVDAHGQAQAFLPCSSCLLRSVSVLTRPSTPPALICEANCVL